MANRRRAYWMKPKDDGLLEYLREIHPTAVPLTVLFWNLRETRGIEYSRETLKRRLARLIETGLVEIPRGENSTKNRFFRITDEGIRYLEGDYQPPELPSDLDELD